MKTSEPVSTPGTGRDDRGQWVPGTSGNPTGRRRSRAAELFDTVVDEDRFLSIVAKAAELAETGNTSMIAAVLKLKVPAPRDSGVLMPLELSPLETLSHAVAALRLIAQAVARGDIDPDAARGLTSTVGAFLEALKVTDLDQRLRTIEEQIKK